MEFLSERERYMANPLRLLRALAEVAMMPVIAVGEAQDVWSEEAYPPIENTEYPCRYENDLLQLYLF